MAIEPFAPSDVRVFDLPGFADRMAAIRAQVRPKLEGLGTALAPDLAKVTGTEIHAHVAKHARRTVNPPDDVGGVRPGSPGIQEGAPLQDRRLPPCGPLLFELGPEFAAKPAWVHAWNRAAPRLKRALARSEGLAWFRNEHDEAPAARLDELDPAGWARLGEDLTRTRDGQLVLGRRVDAALAARWSGPDYARAARETFGALREWFRLR